MPLPFCPVCNKQLGDRRAKHCPLHRPPPSEKTRKIWSQQRKRNKFALGHTSPFKGKKLSWMTGENHCAWKGSKVGYRALHTWVRKQLGTPDKCGNCGKSGLSGKHIHWANKSGKYTRDISDWLRLCTPCHKAYDLKRLSRKDR